jgi:hypothetical protein
LHEYETSGDLTIPLVAPHTTGDEIVPVQHLSLYRAKVQPSGRGVFIPLPVSRYGHCSFTTAEVLTAFGALIAIP